MEHPDVTDRLSDYIGGDLALEEHSEVETHLAECGECRRVLEGLRAVVSKAEGLGTLEPPRDLWAGIAATIQAPVSVAREDAKVIAFPAAGAPSPGDAEADLLSASTRRFAFSTPQLIAASVALMAASSLATWSVGPGFGSGGVGQVAPSTGAVSMTSDVAAPPPELADEVAALERTLGEARAALDPNTVRVLERNLAVIEQAIEDSMLALQQDPGNEFLLAHLERVYERKLTYLRDAARVAEWSS
jgi:hypothetical protein